MKSKKKEIKKGYPKLKECENGVVLFARHKHGTVVFVSELATEECIWQIGQYESYWDEEKFTDFDGEIIIST